MLNRMYTAHLHSHAAFPVPCTYVIPPRLQQFSTPASSLRLTGRFGTRTPRRELLGLVVLRGIVSYQLSPINHIQNNQVNFHQHTSAITLASTIHIQSEKYNSIIINSKPQISDLKSPFRFSQIYQSCLTRIDRNSLYTYEFFTTFEAMQSRSSSCNYLGASSSLPMPLLTIWNDGRHRVVLISGTFIKFYGK